MIHIFISGRVQGVGFRRYIKARALRLRLKGWVKNLPDRRVEAVFQGDKENLEKMLKIVKSGPFLAEVWDIQISEEEDKDLSDFVIIK